MAFTPFRIGGLEVRNRFIKTANADFYGQSDGSMSDEYARYLGDLAEGGAGIVTLSPACVRSDFRLNNRQLSMASDAAAQSCAHAVECIRKSGAKAFCTLDYTDPVLVDYLLSIPKRSDSWCLRATGQVRRWIQALPERDLSGILEMFVSGIMRAKASGYDGVMFNATFGSFLECMSRADLNLREDKWGKGAEACMNFMKELLGACREMDMPSIVRWNLKDYKSGGKTLADGIEACRRLESYGADLLELVGFASIESIQALHNDIKDSRKIPVVESSRTPDLIRMMHAFTDNMFLLKKRDRIPLPFEYVWGHAHFNVRPVKEAVGIPVSILGGVRSLKSAEKMLEEGICDCISLMQTLVYDPCQCRKFATGESLYSGCISCNACMLGMFASLENVSRPYLHKCVVSRGGKQ